MSFQKRAPAAVAASLVAAGLLAGCSQPTSSSSQAIPNAASSTREAAKRTPRISSTTAFFVANDGHAGNPSLALFEGSGNTPIGKITNALMSDVIAVAWDGTFVYTANEFGSNVYIYDVLNSNGTYVNGNETPEATLNTDFNYNINALAINPTVDLGSEDNVVIVGGINNAPEIEEYQSPTAGNAFLKRIYGPQFNIGPSGLAISSNGDYFVSSMQNDGIQRFAAKSSGGNAVVIGGAVGSVPLDRIAIATNATTSVEYIVATAPTLPAVYIWRTSSITNPATNKPDYILKSSAFGYPSGIGIDGSSNIYVSDSTNNKVYEFDSSSNLPAHGTLSPTHTFSAPVFDGPNAISMPVAIPL